MTVDRCWRWRSARYLLLYQELFRGLDWKYVLTLLSQADSCIGSKSSINLGPQKYSWNFQSTKFGFVGFLDTLDVKEMRSGVGEILKVHAIAGQENLMN